MAGARQLAAGPGCCCDKQACPGIIFQNTSSTLAGVVKPNEANWKVYESWSAIQAGGFADFVLDPANGRCYVMPSAVPVRVSRFKIPSGGDFVNLVFPSGGSTMVGLGVNVTTGDCYLNVSNSLRLRLGATGADQILKSPGAGESMGSEIEVDSPTGYVFYEWFNSSGFSTIRRMNGDGSGDIQVRPALGSGDSYRSFTIDSANQRLFYLRNSASSGHAVFKCDFGGGGNTQIFTAVNGNTRLRWRPSNSKLYVNDAVSSVISTVPCCKMMNHDGTQVVIVLPGVTLAPAVAPYALGWSFGTRFDFYCLG